MCAVSVVYDYGKNIPFATWQDEELRREFKRLLDQAHEFDVKTNQPDCEDSEKKRWWNAIEEAHK